MDAPVGDEAAEREAPDLAAHGVEAGDGDDIGCVVDDQVAAGGAFEGADVAAFAADDAAFHLFAGELDDGDGGFGGDFGGDALDGGGDDIACAFVGFFPDALLGLADEAVGFVADFRFHLLDQPGAGFFDGQIADLFEASLFFGGQVFEFAFAIVELALAALELSVAAIEVFAARVDRLFAPDQAVFGRAAARSAGRGFRLPFVRVG